MKGSNKLIASYKLANFEEISEIITILTDIGFVYNYDKIIPDCIPNYIGICDDKEYVELISYFRKDIKEFTDKNKFLEFAKTI